jgi:hypothetical protein
MGTPASKACHNCRRRRLKCDRAVPSCAKCFHTGQECLGYGKLFLWNQGVASRGKMMGKTFPVPGSESVSGSGSKSLPEPYDQKKEATTVPSQDALVYTGPGFFLSGPLLDPLYQSLDESSRRYLSHCRLPLDAHVTGHELKDKKEKKRKEKRREGRKVILS